MRKSILVLVCALALVGTQACSVHKHVVGKGAQTAVKEEARQWYILWGLVPINEVDTRKMADGKSDYTIETKTSFLDIVINIFTNIVTVSSRTVEVTK